MRYLILSVAFIMMLLAGCAKTDDDVLPLPPTGVVDTLKVAQISIVTENSIPNYFKGYLYQLFRNG
jgi:nitrous oxide reductase accessory protein NosL